MLKKYLKDTENFHLTYGDGLTSQNLKKLYQFHIKNKKIATVTAVRPPVRFGELNIKKKSVETFKKSHRQRKVGSMEVFLSLTKKYLVF